MTTSTKTKKNQSFALPSNKPVDVEYRLKRAAQVLDQAIMFLSAIDPTALPDELLNGLLTDAQRLAEGVGYAQGARPTKKSRKATAEEKKTAEAAVETAMKAVREKKASKKSPKAEGLPMAKFKFSYRITTAKATRTAREQAPGRACVVFFSTEASTEQQAYEALDLDIESFRREGCDLVTGTYPELLNRADPEVQKVLWENGTTHTLRDRTVPVGKRLPAPDWMRVSPLSTPRDTCPGTRKRS